MQLDEVHVKEYHRLKNVAARQSAQYMQEVDSINREQKSDQDRLDNSNRWAGEIIEYEISSIDCTKHQ